MNGLMGGLFGDGRMIRRALIVGGGIVVATFIAVQSLVALLKVVVPDQTQRFSANSVPAGSTRNYTVVRSVLDDQVTTGSIPQPKATRIDPCRN
ncbi:MAG TPA: hypothetical protein PLE50_12055 [Rhabdaerophilum sp.]|nr:hypothetical protein [Rhabdaerophilum sp.]